MTAPKVASNTKNVGVVIIGQGAGRMEDGDLAATHSSGSKVYWLG
jgi:hypothetical protein